MLLDARKARKKVTLADVARMAGVSSMTASRTINYPEKVSEQLRDKVQQAIDTLGYIPNQFASSLASARSHVIGVAIPSLSNTVFNEVLRGIYDVTGRAGYKVVLVDTHYCPAEEERLVRTLLSQSPEAMIITGADQTDACRTMLRRSCVPVVQMMEMVEAPIDMNIGFSHYQAGYDVAAGLLARGCERIGFLGARMDPRVHQRLHGYRRALSERQLNNKTLEVTTEDPSSVGMGGQLMRQLWTQAAGQLDAVFCCNDDLALGALFECQRLGIDIPGQMLLCGFNDMDAMAHVNPSLSSVHTPRYEMGVKAAEMVLGALSDEGETGPKRLDIGYTVKWRDSARAPRPLTA
ncbi:HTH-type transcriptional regulator GntR [Marinimicrobium alkaliphilum]|uniref:LacI family DNA-binding transcriptional regulator n=1 Tax=Marinimicrobium alkaliphilum TaxID=2202654 RepID=UPI000DB9029C|nr:LacI family DNA-binding transcriptional regulator [Marinimicrobium alkaliphilum]